MKGNRVCFEEGKGLHEILWLIKHALGQSNISSERRQIQLIPYELRIFTLEEERRETEREKRKRHVEQERSRELQEERERMQIERQKEISIMEKRKRERLARRQQAEDAMHVPDSPVTASKQTEIRAGNTTHESVLKNIAGNLDNSEEDNESDFI